MSEQKVERLRAIAERAFRSKHNEKEASHALKIFDRLCDSWGATTETKNVLWHELEERYPELDRHKALRRMGRLLREYLQRCKAIARELQKWKPWSEEKLDVGPIKLIEHVDLRAAKYLLSLKAHDFKTLYLARAKKKAEEQAKRKKDGSTKAVREKTIDQLVASDRKHIREICIEFIKGRGRVQRNYAFKAPKTFGRRFARGLQGIWGAFKCLLTKGVCSDFDMVNAHPAILLWVCTTLGIECSKLRHYVENRDRVLVDMAYATGRPRLVCKEQFLISTNESKPIHRSPFPFLNEYDLEMKSIHATLVRHPCYQWVCEHVSDKEDNYNGSFVNLILCYWENVLLEYAVKYFETRNVDVNVLMFDGLMVSRVVDGRPRELGAKDCEWHCRVLSEICKHVLGIDMKWGTKPLTDKRVAVPDDFDPKTLMPVFEELATDFDERNVKVGENYVTINRDGTFTIRTREKFKDYHNHIGCMGRDGEREKFINRWVDHYDDIPFKEQAREYPPGGPADRSVCPEDHFNVWERFAFEKWDENPDGVPFEYNARAVELFRDMVMGLLGDDEAHLTFWMQWNYANLMHPATKSGRCPFIISKQGVGKDTLVMILQKIFGYARCVTESDPSENIWGKFNEVLQSTYLVILTEVGISDFMQGLGRVKHLISQYEYTLNLKGGAKLKKMSSFHRFMGITNIGSQGEITQVPITDDERRFVLFYSSTRLKGNTVFWDEMYSLMEDWNAIRSILQYMLTFEHGPTFADTEIPKTEFQKTAVTTHPILQFVKDYVNETQFDGEKRLSCDELWSEYRSWCTDSNVQLGRMTKEQFGVKLTRFNIPGISQAKAVKEQGKVEKKRTLQYKKIREHFPEEVGDEDAGETGSSASIADGGARGSRAAGGAMVTMLSNGTAEQASVIGSELGNHAAAGIANAGVGEAGPSAPVLKLGGLNLTLKRKVGPTDLFSEKKRAEQKLDRECKGIDVKGFHSAGVMLYNSRGYWMGFERGGGKRVWTDYGGKRQGNETAWETAVRECKEEAGVDIRECKLKRPPDFHSDSKARHVLFWVETDLQPITHHHPNFLEHSQFTEWPRHELHPRLLYDKGHTIQRTRQDLGFEEM